MAEAELVDTLEDTTELVDTLEDTTEVVRTSNGTWDTEMDNGVDTFDSDSDNVIYSKAVPTSIHVDTYIRDTFGNRDTNYDSEEDIDMILTSIGTDAFELYNTELDARDAAIVQLEEVIVPARIKECEHMGSNCEQNKMELPPSEHVTEL